MNLASNNLGGETGYVKASKVQGTSFNVGDEVIYEGCKMIVSKGKDSDGEIKMKPVDWAQGINEIADALRVNASLTKLDVSNCCIREAEAVLQKAVEGRSGFELLIVH